MKFLPSQVQHLSRRMLDHDLASYTLFTNVTAVELQTVNELLDHPQVKPFCTSEYREFVIGSEVFNWHDLDDSISLFAIDQQGNLHRLGFLFDFDLPTLLQAQRGDGSQQPVFPRIGSLVL